MKCKCGAEIKAGEEFCGECGEPRPGSTGQPPKNSGISENTLGLLSYLIGLLAIIFVFTEKKNKFIRFHAIQSLIFNVLYIVILVAVTPQSIYDDYTLYFLALLLFFILWIVLMYKAYKGDKYKLPVIGDYAEKMA